MPSFEAMFMASKGKPITYQGKSLIMVDDFPVEGANQIRYACGGHEMPNTRCAQEEVDMNAPSSEQIRRRMSLLYQGFNGAASQPKLDPATIPMPLRPWIAYAEFWGIAEDYDREELVRRAPQQVRKDLVQLAVQLDDAFDEWLASDEPMNDLPSDEYCAFTWMRMAADYALAISQHR